MTKLLILVQSSSIPIYQRMLQAQLRTWDSLKVPDVSTLFYYGIAKVPGIGATMPDELVNDERVYAAPAHDMWRQMHWKHKLTLEYVWDRDWDMIFRTNASSYVDKAMALAMAQKLPKEGCYCGCPDRETNPTFVSGCGVFLSRDLVEILRDEITEDMCDAEDAAMGEILIKGHGVKVTPGYKRFDYWWNETPEGTVNFPDVYHYRCKPRDGDRDRTKDIRAFEAIHLQKLRWRGMR